ncbi:MAG: PEP-CTERM sorting domain-containing protein [Phycisphaerales bacterium]|nr:PEP-CTERM sorting domain-containing protein [Phycisphaerales bacterium]
MLTQAGIDRGFSLTTFVDGFVPVQTPGGLIGPFGVDYQADGTILVSTESGNIQRFQNVDGQSAGNVPVLANHGFANAVGLAHVGSSIYMTQQLNNRVIQLNSNGTFNRAVATGLSFATGIAANPLTGHLYVSTNASGGRIVDVDPVAGTFTTIANANADGLSLSGDSSILFAALSNNHLVGYSVATGIPVFDSGVIANVGGIDGSAVGYGEFDGSVFVNARGGFVVEVDLATMTQTIIASGGSRGDFVAADPSQNGDLLLTQSDRILRLTGVPEPATLSMLAVAGAVILRRRRRAQA